MENKVIILGINHESTLGFVRCFGEAGIMPICVIYGSNKGYVFSSKYPSIKHFENTAEECLDFIIKQFSDITPKPFLFGSNDTSASVINNNFNRLKDHFLIESAKDKEGEIVRLMNKWELYRIAEKNGLLVASTVLLNKGEKIPGDIIYPVFTKSIRSIDGGKSDEKICNNALELSDFLRDCHAKVIMVQRFIEKKEEFNYFGFSCNGQVYIPYENHRTRFSDGALSGYHIFLPTVHNELYEKVVSMIKSTDYNGLFSVEFLVDHAGNYYFMEVNFRHDGATYLVKSGVNIPLEYCKRVLNQELSEIQLKMQKIIGMRESADFKQQVKSGKMSKIRWFIEFMKVDSHMLWNVRDIKPFFYFVKQLLKHN